MLLFLTTNMAAVSSRANQQYCFCTVYASQSGYFRFPGLNSKVCPLMKVFELYFKVAHAVYLLVK